MSYLLTEIALEMLGFTFFNINGQAQTTNFQKSGPVLDVPFQSVGDSDLEKILMDETAYLPENYGTIVLEDSPIEECKESKENENENVNAKDTSTTTTTRDDSKSPQAVTEPTPAQSSKRFLNNSKISSQIMVQKKRIVVEVLRDRGKYVQEKLEANKIENVDLGVNSLMRSYFIMKQKNLEEDFENMNKFRRKVEQKIMKINSANYENYVATFKGTTAEQNKNF